MKCVKDLADNVKRVSNEKADAYVKTGEYKYCPKREWKESRKK